MKKFLRTVLIIIAFLLTIYSIALANQQEGCAKSAGDPIYGTYCVVSYVHGPAEYQYVFDTFYCTANCSAGGTHCCYVLQVVIP
jgi:hypothetical protein